MKKILTLASLALCLFAVAGCSTKLELRFASLPGQIPAINDRGFENKVEPALAPFGGFVYIQTGYDDSAAVYGPYAVTKTDPLVIRGIPEGEYKRLAVFYTPTELSGPGLPLKAQDDDDFWDKAGSPEVAGAVFHDASAVALFGDTKISRGSKKILQATLVPQSSIVFDSETQDSPHPGDTAGAVRKQFIKLESGNAESIYATLSSFDGQGLLYIGTVSLYGADGTLLETKNFNRKIPEDLPEAVLFPFRSRPAPFYLYLEYISIGDRSIPLLYY